MRTFPRGIPRVIPTNPREHGSKHSLQKSARYSSVRMSFPPIQENTDQNNRPHSLQKSARYCHSHQSKRTRIKTTVLPLGRNSGPEGHSHQSKRTRIKTSRIFAAGTGSPPESFPPIQENTDQNIVIRQRGPRPLLVIPTNPREHGSKHSWSNRCHRGNRRVIPTNPREHGSKHCRFTSFLC